MAYEEYRKAYRIKHIKRIKKYLHEYSLSHKKEKQEYDKNYRKKNKERIKIKKHKAYLENRKTILKKHKEYAKRTGIYHWRGLTKYETWRLGVYKKYNYICQKCGKTHCKVIAHHIKPAKDYPKLRYDLNNGICLCEDCHKKLHYL